MKVDLESSGWHMALALNRHGHDGDGVSDAFTAVRK